MLKIHSKDFKFEETIESIESYRYDNFDPMIDVEFLFYGKLICSKCRKIVVFVGNGYFDVDFFDDGQEWVQTRYEFFYPHYFYPSLNIIEINENCPKEIVEEIKSSFSLFLE